MSGFDEQNVVRDGGGRFDEKSHTAPDISLTESPAWSPGDPVAAQVVLQRWNDNDYAVEVGQEAVDVRAILDTYPLEELVDPDELLQADNDFIFHDAQQHGLIDHDGPFYVDLREDVYRDYYEAREASGQVGPVADRFIDTPERAAARLATVRGQMDELLHREYAILTDLVVAHTASIERPEGTKALLIAGIGAGGVSVRALDENEHSTEIAQLFGPEGIALRAGLGDRTMFAVEL